MEYNKVMNENVFSSIRVRLLFVRCERDMRERRSGGRRWKKKVSRNVLAHSSLAYAYIMLTYGCVSCGCLPPIAKWACEHDDDDEKRFTCLMLY
jgi:hypothetical protein